MKILFLGTGPSLGVPIPTCNCDTCISDDLRDKRLRSSIYIETEKYSFLIDCGPDFRQQALKFKIKKIDFILITHKHNDHIGGLDDLRPFNYFQNKQMDIYGSDEVVNDIRRRFYYSFDEERYPGAPVMRLKTITRSDNLKFGENEISVIEGMHGSMPVFGFRIGDFGYITDFKYISESEIQKLQGVKILVVNALRPDKPHKLHFNKEEALDLINKVNPQLAYLTHLSHHWKPIKEAEKSFPENVFLAYDGLDILI